LLTVFDRDIFGIGGYDDSPTNRLGMDDMLESLQFAVDGGNRFVPHIYRALRRRDRLLRDNLMYMGSLTAFADYFPLWTTADGGATAAGGRDAAGGRGGGRGDARCDVCTMLAPPVSTRRRSTPWL